MKTKIKKIGKYITYALLTLFLIFLVFLLLKSPSHDRNWEIGQEKLPQISIQLDEVVINNLRNFDWQLEPEKTKINYETKKFKLSDIVGVEVVISHFSENKSIAHDFLNFRLKDGSAIGISVETRREIGEDFSPFKGILSEYELIYVVASYEDVVGVRKNVREEEVYLYPTTATPEQSQAFFVSIAEAINHLYEEPEFYNTITKNCTNILARHIEDLTDLELPFWQTTFAPGDLDEILYELKVIPDEGSLEMTREKYLLR